jgi:hypothetical protein
VPNGEGRDLVREAEEAGVAADALVDDEARVGVAVEAQRLGDLDREDQGLERVVLRAAVAADDVVGAHRLLVLGRAVGGVDVDAGLARAHDPGPGAVARLGDRALDLAAPRRRW